MEIEYYKKNRYLNKFTRAVFFLAGDTFSLFLSAFLAYLILAPSGSLARPFPVEHTVIISVSVLLGLGIFRMYSVNWRHTSLRDLIRIILGIVVGGGLSAGIARFFLPIGDYEISFTTLLLVNAIIILSGFRISRRVYSEFLHTPRKKNKHTIIFGAESEGEQILRDIFKNNHWNLSVYAIFDDRVVPGLMLHGVRILGGKDKMIEYISSHPVDQLIVAFPDISKRDLKAIVDKIKTIRPEMDIKILPSFHSLTDDPVGFRHIRDVSIEDILGREPVQIDIHSIKKSIKDKTVLVTGAGGSIGSELVRQCAKLDPGTLVALDIDETELFHIENELKGIGDAIIPCVASVTDERKMHQILHQYKPDVIFHAAAYKHVPMMESFPEEAIKVNVGGTRLLAQLACEHEVEKFVMVSTDKAVNPTNVMGATKRIAEEICMAYNTRGKTQFISVRFGNVLGSRGSVVPLFIEQIKKGGPLTVTDPQMKRYFMTIPEAVLLVMEAGAMGNGGEVYVLDMGEPVKILDMAKDLIRLHNLEPEKDIAIEFTGLRPGEKLFEELLNAEEGVLETEHQEIFKAVCSTKLNANEIDVKITQIFDQIENACSAEALRNHLKLLVPTYACKTKKNADYQINGSSTKMVAG